MQSGLLSDARVGRLVEPCRERAGDGLRSVTYFTQDDFEQIYLRSDLEQEADLTTFIGVEWRESDITENAYRGTELGELAYTLRRFENGYLLRIETPSDGVFVTIDELTLEGFDELAATLEDVVESFRESRE